MPGRKGTSAKSTDAKGAASAGASAMSAATDCAAIEGFRDTGGPDGAPLPDAAAKKKKYTNVKDPVFGSIDRRDVKPLHRIYDSFMQNREPDEVTRLSIIKVCRWTLEQERLVDARNYKDAKDLAALIKAETDKWPPAGQSGLTALDKLVKAIDNAGIPTMGYEELCRVLAEHSTHPRYPYTRDAADMMLLQILRATGANEKADYTARAGGGPFFDGAEEEFSPEADGEERELFASLGLTAGA